MSGSTALRVVYGERCAAKRLATDLGIAIVTARGYLTGHLPVQRLDEIYDRAQRRIDERLAELAEAEAELARLQALRRARP